MIIMGRKASWYRGHRESGAADYITVWRCGEGGRGTRHDVTPTTCVSLLWQWAPFPSHFWWKWTFQGLILQCAWSQLTPCVGTRNEFTRIGSLASSHVISYDCETCVFHSE
jgi:hypothetical protein